MLPGGCFSHALYGPGCASFSARSQEVELFLAQRKYHESFLQQGGLGVLKGWLEPYSDGTLPNVRVRTAVLKCLQVGGDRRVGPRRARLAGKGECKCARGHGCA